MKTLLLKGGVVSTLAITGLHVTSHSYLAVENYLTDRYSHTKQAVIQGLAQDLGYEVKAPTDKQTIVDIARREAKLASISPSLAVANLLAESSANGQAISHVGAIGLMQVMPQTAKQLCGIKDWRQLLNDEINIRCGVKVLAYELKQAKGDPSIALQAYNGGSKCVNKCRESINHAKRVLTILATGDTELSHDRLTDSDRKDLNRLVNSIN